ncbi:MAG: oligosaccharide flippase family protein, partial [Nitrospiraceae bacterium]
SPATLSETLDVVTFNVVAVAAAAAGWGVWSLVVGVLAARLCGLTVLYCYAGWYPKWHWHPARLGELVRAGLPFQGVSFLVLARDAIVPVVVSAWNGITAVGLLNMAITIAALPLHVVSLVGRVLFPLLSGLQGDLHRFASATERALNRVATVIYPIAGILLVGAGLIVPLVLGERWVPSVPAIQLLCLSTIMSGTATVLVMALNSLGRAETVFRLNLFWTGGLWGLALVLVPLMGFVGYAVASVCQAATGVLALLALRRVIPVRVWRPIGGPFVASTASALAFWGLVPWIHNILSLLAGGLFAMVVYAGLVAWMGGAVWRAELREDWNGIRGSREPGRV